MSVIVPLVVATHHRNVAPAPDVITLRTATVADAPAIHALIEAHLAEGHLLPRELDEIAIRADRFVVALAGTRVHACAELAPLSRTVAEVRSLVVGHDARGLHVGGRLVAELLERASRAGFERICAFTHSPAYFVRKGFSIVPHLWLPEKVLTDCATCRHFRGCGQYAVMLTLARAHQPCVPLAALHG